MTALAKRAVHLTHLSLFQLFRLTDAGVRELAVNLSALEQLDLHGCMALTRRTVQHLLAPDAKLRSLRSLDLAGCRNIPRDDIDRLKAARTELDVISF